MEGNNPSPLRNIKPFRLLALVPALLSAIAFALQLVAIISGTTTDLGTSFPIITVSFRFYSKSQTLDLIIYR